MRLLPGVRYENTVDSLGMSFGTSVPNVGGARRDWSNVIVDGVVANEVGASSLMAQQINLDAIAEVQRARSTRTAPSTGARAAVRCRSSARAARSNYHGNLYYYGRNESAQRDGLLRESRRTSRSRATASTPTAPTSAARCPRPTRNSSSSTRMEAPLVSRPGPLRNWTMPTDAEMQGDFSQTLDSQGRLINIKDPLREGACNAVTGGPGCFPGNIIPAEPHQLERPRAAEHAPARQQLRSHVHAGPVQLLDAGERRQPEDEQHRPRRLAADVERQPVLHVQGLVLGPARQRDHRRPEQVGVLQHALPEHGPRRAA